MEAAKLALDEAGIEIPYPHFQLFLENVEDRVWQKLAQQTPRSPGRPAWAQPPPASSAIVPGSRRPVSPRALRRPWETSAS